MIFTLTILLARKYGRNGAYRTRSTKVGADGLAQSSTSRTGTITRATLAASALRNDKGRKTINQVMPFSLCPLALKGDRYRQRPCGSLPLSSSRIPASAVKSVPRRAPAGRRASARRCIRRLPPAASVRTTQAAGPDSAAAAGTQHDHVAGAQTEPLSLPAGAACNGAVSRKTSTAALVSCSRLFGATRAAGGGVGRPAGQSGQLPFRAARA